MSFVLKLCFYCEFDLLKLSYELNVVVKVIWCLNCSDCYVKVEMCNLFNVGLF